MTLLELIDKIEKDKGRKLSFVELGAILLGSTLYLKMLRDKKDKP
jgi:hypothetical protein